jgi:hypothetical protein
MDIALWGEPKFTASTLSVAGTAEFLPEGDADVSFGWSVGMMPPGGPLLQFYDDGSSPFGHGVRFEGDKGWVHVVRGGIKAEPKSLLGVTIKPGEEHLYHSDHHQMNFLECVKSRRDPAAPVEVCHAATTATLIADIASRTGRKLIWDWTKEEFVKDETANRMLTRSMRSPWQI